MIDAAFLGGFLSATGVAVLSAVLSRRSQLSLAREEQRRRLCQEIESLVTACAEVSKRHASGKVKTSRAARALFDHQNALRNLLSGEAEILLSKNAQHQGWMAIEKLQQTIQDISYRSVFDAPYFLLNALSEENLRMAPWVRWRQCVRAVRRAKWPIRQFISSGHPGGSLLLGAIYSREGVLVPTEAFEAAVSQAAVLEQKAPSWNVRFSWSDRGDGYVNISWSVREPSQEVTGRLRWLERNSQYRSVRRFDRVLHKAIRKATHRRLKEISSPTERFGSPSAVRDYTPTPRARRERGVKVPSFYL